MLRGLILVMQRRAPRPASVVASRPLPSLVLPGLVLALVLPGLALALVLPGLALALVLPGLALAGAGAVLVRTGKGAFLSVQFPLWCLRVPTTKKPTGKVWVFSRASCTTSSSDSRPGSPPRYSTDCIFRQP